MRLVLVAVAVACVACSTGPDAPDSIAGMWESESHLMPAGPMSLGLQQSGSAISGSGSWNSVSYEVSGTYRPPHITLNIAPVFYVNDVPTEGTVVSYTGTAVDANTIVISGTTFHRPPHP